MRDQRYISFKSSSVWSEILTMRIYACEVGSLNPKGQLMPAQGILFSLQLKLREDIYFAPPLAGHDVGVEYNSTSSPESSCHKFRIAFLNNIRQGRGKEGVS